MRSLQPSLRGLESPNVSCRDPEISALPSIPGGRGEGGGGSEHPAPPWAMPNVQPGWSPAPSPRGGWVLHPHCQSRGWSLGGCRDPSARLQRLGRAGCSDSPHGVRLLGDLQLF